MIFIGYQGIGKSTLAKCKNNFFIDLESGNFWINNSRYEDWYIPYCNIAEDLSSQGYNVFVSSHKSVRDQLQNSKEKVCVIIPALYLKEEWIQKLKHRYELTKLDKDYKAYMNAKDRFTDNIIEIMESGFDEITILNMNYNLQDLIDSYIKEYHRKDYIKNFYKIFSYNSKYF